VTQAIIGLYSPYPRSGKSTFAQAMLNAVPGAQLLKFADGMRDAVVSVVAPFFEGGSEEVENWLSDDRKDTRLIPTLHVTLRHMLQTIGHEWGRTHIHQDLWVKRVKQRITKLHNVPLIVIDDLRYENEYEMLRDLDAVMVRIKRPFTMDATTLHPSDARLESMVWDMEVSNSRTAHQLELEALALVWELELQE
jgi:hypothetical protein